jgi:1-acyl-sn-glycerol-3-phosphate acyltransferase
MAYTIFDTPVVRTVLKYLSKAVLRTIGWRSVDARPDKAKDRFVMALAPHTSNWDFVLIYLIAFDTGIRGHWLGKHTLFKGPLRPFMRWLGGIPVVRSRSMNLVDQCVKAYDEDPRVMIAITPEGTRSRVKDWRTGFYHIAMGARVPVALAYLDYRRKVGGIGSMFHPTGDIERDLPEIRAYYRDITAYRPENFDPGPPAGASPTEK